MANAVSDSIISVLGSQLFQPIADLTEQLLSRERRKADRVSSGHFEAGYSASIIVLLVATVESFVQWDRYFAMKRARKPLSGNTVKYLKERLRYRRAPWLAELFDVRNAVAHNHLYEIDYDTPDSGGRKHRETRIVSATHRLKQPPGSQVRVPRTRRLRLHLNPIALDRTDASKAFALSMHTLRHISRRGMRKLPLVQRNVRFRQRRMPFEQVGTVLEGAL
jgi:hypothetical protein